MKRDTYRWISVIVSILLHMILVAFLWRQINATGSMTSLNLERRIDVHVITEPTVEVAKSNTWQFSLEDIPLTQPSIADLTAIDVPPKPIFYGPQEVDKLALPYSAPNLDLLGDVRASGVPIRLRLYFDATGLITAIEPLQVLPDDQEVFERISKMLHNTTFAPAKLGGLDVSSYQDIEFNLGSEHTTFNTSN